MRALKVAVVVMGVLILGGTAVLIAAIVKRASGPAPQSETTATLVPSGPLPYTASLDVPAGSRITGIAAPGGLLAVSVGGGPADEVVVLDPRTGRTLGRVTLAAPPAGR